MSTDNLRRQHRALLRLSTEITKSLRADAIGGDANKLRTQLAILSGILNVHLAMEDGVMYPQLLIHKSSEVRALARQYVEEMGGIKRMFAEYLRRWKTPEAMRAAPGDFVRESRVVMDALTHRIMREEAKLYPLVDDDQPRGIAAPPAPIQLMRERG